MQAPIRRKAKFYRSSAKQHDFPCSNQPAEDNMPQLTMCLVFSLSMLALLLGMYISWKHSDDIRQEVALYGRKYPSSQEKYQDFWSRWTMSIFSFFSQFQTEELSFRGLLKTRKRLEQEGRLSEEMDRCLVNLIEILGHEAHALLKNAQLTLHCDGTLLEFVSGNGENEIAMYDYGGELFYKTKESTWAAYFMKVFRKPPKTD